MIIKVLIHQKVMILIVYILNKTTVKVHESKLMELIENMDIFTIIIGYFNLPLTLTELRKKKKNFRIPKI